MRFLRRFLARLKNFATGRKTTNGIAGTAVGLVGARIVSHLMAGLLYGVRPTDPVTFWGSRHSFDRYRSACLLPSGAAQCLSIPWWRYAVSSLDRLRYSSPAMAACRRFTAGLASAFVCGRASAPAAFRLCEEPR